MELTISSVNYAPAELHEQAPFIVRLEREIPGDDRPDYWIGSLNTPLRWMVDGHEREVTHVILTARWAETLIAPGIEQMPVGIAFVTDASLLSDSRLSFEKCAYVAVGLATDTSGEGA